MALKGGVAVPPQLYFRAAMADIGLIKTRWPISYPKISTTINAPQKIKGREFTVVAPGGPARRIYESVVRAGQCLSNVHVGGDKTLDVVLDQDYATLPDDQISGI